MMEPEVGKDWPGPGPSQIQRRTLACGLSILRDLAQLPKHSKGRLLPSAQLATFRFSSATVKVGRESPGTQARISGIIGSSWSKMSSVLPEKLRVPGAHEKKIFFTCAPGLERWCGSSSKQRGPPQGFNARACVSLQ